MVESFVALEIQSMSVTFRHMQGHFFKDIFISRFWKRQFHDWTVTVVSSKMLKVGNVIVIFIIFIVIITIFIVIITIFIVINTFLIVMITIFIVILKMAIIIITFESQLSKILL